MNIKKSRLIMLLAFLVGIGLLAYPSFANWWNSLHQSRMVGSYLNKIEDNSKEENEKMIQEAKEYNKTLLGRNNQRFEMTDQELEEYFNKLGVSDSGVMGIVEIPKLGIELPIYHDTDEAILQIAIGHIPGTSLPVGGSGSHSVLSGHRGLPSAKLFTDIDQLREGDIFKVKVLDRVLTYEVDQIRTVLPRELDDLKIYKGEDFMTLQTCTPYGINTHRLLVRGHRINTSNETQDISISSEAKQVDSTAVTLILMFAVVLPILAIIIMKNIFVFLMERRQDDE